MSKMTKMWKQGVELQVLCKMFNKSQHEVIKHIHKELTDGNTNTR